MANRKIVAGAAMAGALAVGGAFGVALGTPGVSGGQQVSAVINPAAATTTVPNGARPTMPGGPGGPGGFHRGPGHGDGAQFEAAAKAIGISVEDLRKELASGKSIADVAKAHNVARQTVVDAMVKAGEKQLDEAKKALPDRVSKAVDAKFKAPDGAKGPGGKGPGFGHGPGMMGPGNQLETAAKTIGVSVDDLRTALKSGKSIADVAKSKNVPEQKVIDAMVAEASKNIDAAVTDGKLDKDRAADIKKDLPDHIKNFVEFAFKPGQGGPEMPGGHGMGPGKGPDAPGGN
jgi:polyhydroxyalkanoate synthesis regulator phasin